MREPTNKLVIPELLTVLKRTRLGRFKLRLLAEEKRGYEEVIASMLERDRGARFLDLGFGDWRLGTKLVKKVKPKEVFGIDIDIRFPDVGERKSIQGDLNNPFPVDDEGFDVIIASQIIEHLWNTDRFLREIHRVLKPTGYAIISTPNLASWHNVGYLLFGRQPEPCSVSDEMDRFEGPAHRRLFTVPGLTKVLKFHGFRLDVVKGSGYHPFPLPIARLICLMDRSHPTTINFKVRKI